MSKNSYLEATDELHNLLNCLPRSRTALTRMSTSHPNNGPNLTRLVANPFRYAEAMTEILASTWSGLFYILTSRPIQRSIEFGLADDQAVLLRRHVQVMTKIQSGFFHSHIDHPTSCSGEFGLAGT